MTDEQRIEAFWGWWEDRAAHVAMAIEAGNAADFAREISRKVGRLHPDLQWELAPGHQARHALCVTSAGRPELRPLAERWFRAAPSADEAWEYRPARAADPDALENQLAFGPHTLALRDTRVRANIDEERELVDVQVYHPAFADMPEDARGQVTFLLLDWLLGEDGVERWLGHIESVVDVPVGSLPADALVEIVGGLEGRSEENKWVLLQGERAGALVLVTARRPLKWIDHPLLDLYIAIELPYSERDEVGLPEPRALEHLRSLEDDLMAVLGDTAILAAHETTNGVRTFHLYADSQDPASSERIARWVERVPSARVHIATDPGWRAVRPYS